MPYPSLQGLPQGASITGVTDYDIQKVEWNKYELSIGVTVCFLQLPSVVFTTNKADQNGMPIYAVMWNSFSRVVASNEKATGNPSVNMNPETVSSLPSEIKIPLTSQESWNEFLLRDGNTLRGRSILTQLRQVLNQFDNLGMPIFSVNAQTVIDVQLTEKSRE
jgi:hypothetical protein